MSIKKKKSLVVLQGVFAESFFDELQNRNIKEVFILEGRPKLEPAIASSQALLKRKISPTLISDNMAGFLFYKNWVKEVWLAYQLAGHNGALCDIGALILGVLGKNHRIPVLLYPAGRKTPFLGKDDDLMYFKNIRIAPKGIKGYVPLVEWLPKQYITKIYRHGKHSPKN